MGGTARQFRAATLTLNGRTVTIVQVASYSVHNPVEAQRLHREFSSQFPEHEIVLAGMAVPKTLYFGDPQLVATLRRLPSFRIHWQEHRMNEGA